VQKVHGENTRTIDGSDPCPGQIPLYLNPVSLTSLKITVFAPHKFLFSESPMDYSKSIFFKDTNNNILKNLTC
jgi:hypothetical protein